MPLATPTVIVYQPAGQLPVAVMTGALGADTGQALVYQWKSGTFRLLLKVDGNRIAQSAEAGWPVLAVTAGGQTRVYGWDGTKYTER